MDPITGQRRCITVTFPVGVLDALDAIIPAGQRNRFIVEATEHAVQRAQLDRALQDLRLTAAWRVEDSIEPTLVRRGFRTEGAPE